MNCRPTCATAVIRKQESCKVGGRPVSDRTTSRAGFCSGSDRVPLNSPDVASISRPLSRSANAGRGGRLTRFDGVSCMCCPSPETAATGDDSPECDTELAKPERRRRGQRLVSVVVPVVGDVGAVDIATLARHRRPHARPLRPPTEPVFRHGLHPPGRNWRPCAASADHQPRARHSVHSTAADPPPGLRFAFLKLDARPRHSFAHRPVPTPRP